MSMQFSGLVLCYARVLDTGHQPPASNSFSYNWTINHGWLQILPTIFIAMPGLWSVKQGSYEDMEAVIVKDKLRPYRDFLSSAYVVRPGPKSQNSWYFSSYLSVFHSVSNFVCLNNQAYTCLIHFYKNGPIMHHASCNGLALMEDDL